MNESQLGGSAAQRGVAEAMACRDMLTPVPPRPRLAARLAAPLLAARRRLSRQGEQALDTARFAPPAVARFWR